jgi:heme exporter protein C
VLRGSFAEQQQRARISAVYNIFAYAALIPLLFILPRLTDSLHPGNGGNPGFGTYDMDNRMRMVFYPAVIAWTLLGLWILNVKSRFEIIRQKLYENA